MVEASRALVLALCLVACAPRGSDDSLDAAPLASFKIAGSTALLPFATQAANAFMKGHPGVSIQVDPGGSHAGLAKLAARNVAIGTSARAAFGSIVLGGDPFVSGAIEQESSAQLQATLLETRGAISYLAIPYRHPDLAVFEVEGKLASSENISTGVYPIWSYEHMYTLGPATDQVRAFIDFVLSAPMQKDTLVRTGVIPIGSMKVSRERD